MNSRKNRTTSEAQLKMNEIPRNPEVMNEQNLLWCAFSAKHFRHRTAALATNRRATKFRKYNVTQYSHCLEKQKPQVTFQSRHGCQSRQGCQKVAEYLTVDCRIIKLKATVSSLSHSLKLSKTGPGQFLKRDIILLTTCVAGDTRREQGSRYGVKSYRSLK